MKHFAEYLRDNKKTYKFIVRAAGELPENFADNMERSMNKYEIVSFSKSKTTPITESPLDFPRLRNVEVTHYEVVTSYPTTSAVLENQLSNDLAFPQSHLIVRGENEPMELYANEEEDDSPYEVLLTNPEMTDESAQEDVGANRVMSLLAELEVARKERETDPATGATRTK